MPIRIRLQSAFVAAMLAVTQAGAQAPVVPVRGVAFDGLRGQPLRDARITLVGGNRITTTDSRGRFHFDSVPAGVYTFAMQHAALDSLGFNGLSTRATISTGREEVRIAVPTFAALWREACGPTPVEGGFVYGTIRDATTMRPVANAVVEVTWTDMIIHSRNKGRSREVVQRLSRSETRSDSTGSYSACSVAAGHWMRIHAARDSSESGFIDLAPSEVGLQRRDLVIARNSSADSTSGGMISGLVIDAQGRTFADARVVLDGATEVRTDDAGRFLLRNVPAGTRQLEVMSIGLVPVTTVVDVPVRDTATISVQFATPATLDGMKVVGARGGRVLSEEFNLRRRIGVGYTVDSTQVARFQNLPALFQTFPSLTVEYRRPIFTISMPRGTGRCVPDIRIDGVEAGFGHLIDLQPAEVAGVEIYNRALIVPAQFAKAGHPPECGMILVWTKYGFRNR